MLTYCDLFFSYRKDVSEHARLYTQGLLNPEIRKNVEDIAESVPGGNVQNLQQFISCSKWSHTEVMRRTALNADELIGDEHDACLLIDESGIPKKGNKSVGVARQWLGSLGKTDNGQVGVYASLCNNNRATLINTRLYLPRCWIDDPARCEQAGIPVEYRQMLTKEELALEMVDDAINQKLRFSWVGADGGYGKGLGFMLNIENKGLLFAVDIHKDQRFYRTRPHPYLPERQNGRGRTPSQYIVDEKPERIDQVVNKLPGSKWTRVVVRDSSKGPLTYEIYAKRVYLWTPDMKETVKQWWLVIRRDAISHSDYKYTLINAPEKTTIKRLAYMQGQRYWIEHAFEVGKGECGLDHYEVRGWTGWHHHMALVMMAQLFLLKVAKDKEAELPLLSAKDIMLLLVYFLPRKEPTVKEIEEEMYKRHARRQKATVSAAKKIKEKLRDILTL